MPKDSSQPDSPGANAGTGEGQDDAQPGLLKRLLSFSGGSKLKMAATVGLGLGMLSGMIWLRAYLAKLSARAPITIASALEALDRGDYSDAQNRVGAAQQESGVVAPLGESLFVLGAVKAHEAEGQWSASRGRAMHLVAARYLQQARSLGVPLGREAQAVFLLGRSLVRGNQPEGAIAALNEALEYPELPHTEIHSLLTTAFLALPEPDLEAALTSNGEVIADESLSELERFDALVSRAEILGRLERYGEAIQALEGLGGSDLQESRLIVARGRLTIESSRGVDPLDQRSMVVRARDELGRATRLDPLNGQVTRRALYWIARSYEVVGDVVEAADQFDQMTKQFGDTPEGLVATLSKAAIAHGLGQTDAALAGYRTVLDAAGSPLTYRNDLLPLSELRKALLGAHQQFTGAGNFAQAMALVDQFTPLFSEIEVTELRAKTHSRWGYTLRDSAQSEEAPELIEGRYHLRAAGVAYEDLAAMRYATLTYTDDLWESGEHFFDGQSYTHAARLFDKYLHHEVERRKGLALLRLGQAYVALDRPDQAIDALRECIELYPRDAVVFQARIECARALRLNDQPEEAESLLVKNLTGDTLTPKSAEWRDSLFELGSQLRESGRFDDAISKLDEAVQRYPDAQQALMARYDIARSYHRRADEPEQLYREAKTESERQKNRRLRDEYLEEALRRYAAVQRKVTIDTRNAESSLNKLLLRNCYTMQGAVLFRLKRYEDARKSYSDASSLFQDEPFVLESFVHIANCWRRLDKPLKARMTIAQAKQVLGSLPRDIDFKITTNFDRGQWEYLLDQMETW
ncbi:MAG: tetratricopeptide repeat protein [Planctomycetota bacterium]